MNLSCIILAAGQSTRMGTSKPLLKFNLKMNFLEKIVTTYQSAGIQDIIIVINSNVKKELQHSSSGKIQECKVIVNHQPGLGRMNSIRIGLRETQNSLVFIQNIDNPFVNEKILISLNNGIGESDFAVPTMNRSSGHPILLSEKVIHAVLQNEKTDINFRVLLKSFKRTNIQVEDPGIFININTPEDYALYFNS
jgi:molybdenum cofactor cytidylyltransferase